MIEVISILNLFFVLPVLLKACCSGFFFFFFFAVFSALCLFSRIPFYNFCGLLFLKRKNVDSEAFSNLLMFVYRLDYEHLVFIFVYLHFDRFEYTGWALKNRWGKAFLFLTSLRIDHFRWRLNYGIVLVSFILTWMSGIYLEQGFLQASRSFYF